MNPFSQTLHEILLGELQITTAVISQDTFTIEQFHSSDTKILSLLEMDPVGQKLTDVFDEFMGMEELIFDKYHLAQDRQELMRIEPISKFYQEYEYYYSFRLLRLEQKILLFIQEITHSAKEYQSISQAYHESHLLRRELDKAHQHLHDLLRDIFPEEVVAQLEKNRHYAPQQFDNVTVLFTDFQDFTQISESLPPQELVATLDRFFTQFDLIVERFKMTKIKTIGDSYMAAGGLTSHPPAHPALACLVGLEIQRLIRQINELTEKRNPWQARIGIHTGPVITGVLGDKKSAFDIWGDTVNIASRMESFGEAGQVNISKETYSQIKELFLCDHRGPIEVKNKGRIDMYFVQGIRPQYSRHQDGILPNADFYQALG